MSKATPSQITPTDAKRYVSIYTLPEGANPLVRIEVLPRCISAGWLFDICCHTIGLYENSRQFFALFRGLNRPIKKYEPEENILLPVKVYPLAVLRWSFNIKAECKFIKTDPMALRLLALQYKSEIDRGIKVISTSNYEKLAEYENPKFFCFKQYVDVARTIESYDSMTIKNVEVVKKIKLVNQVLCKGLKIDVVCNPKGMKFISASFEIKMPWRKIRRFTEISKATSVSFEVLLNEKIFVTLELNTIQRIYFLQVTGEYNNLMEREKLSEFRQTECRLLERQNKLAWTLFKEEIFGGGGREESKKGRYLDFDRIDEQSSSDTDETEDDLKITDTSSLRKLKVPLSKYEVKIPPSNTKRSLALLPGVSPANINMISSSSPLNSKDNIKLLEDI